MSLAPPTQQVLEFSYSQPMGSSTTVASRDAAHASDKQSFCGNVEGWGPFNPVGDNLTPCFLDGSIAIFAICGILLELCAVWYLLRQDARQPLVRKWVFGAKMGVLAFLTCIVAAQAVLTLGRNPQAAVQDVQFWSPAITFLSLVVISAVQWIEHRRSRTPNAVVLFYWLVFIIFYAVKTISLAPRTSDRSHLPGLVLHHVSLGLAAAELALEWLVPVSGRPKHYPGQGEENPRNYADVFSDMMFSWLSPFMKYGYNNTITEKDLCDNRPIDTAKSSGSRLENAWAKAEAKGPPSMTWALIRAFGTEYFLSGVFELIADLMRLVKPLILQYFILFVASRTTPDPQPYSKGAALAVLMFVTATVETLAQQQTTQLTIETGTHVKTALQVKLYQKAIRLSGSARGAKSTGDIVNLMSVDTQKVWLLARLSHWTWSAPLQLVLGMLLLYKLLGWSMLAGVAIMIVTLPLNAVVVSFSSRYEKAQMKAKDGRTRLTTEIIENMKSIKLYAWGSAYLSKLRRVREDEELKAARAGATLNSAFQILWSLPTYLVGALTFGVYVYTQPRPLTSDVIFPALAVFNVINFPLSVFPMLISLWIDAVVSGKRLAEFFRSDELQPGAVTRQTHKTDSGDVVLIEDAAFVPSKDDPKVLLEVNHFSSQAAELDCIIGQVGSGKSTFLNAILGDLYKTKGEVTLCGTVAYVPQTAWVMNATVKENIVFGHPWDRELYNKTLKACALLPDLSSLPDGDMTEVGERGISLSGGQKARLSLARAVYAQADVYVLDDCLSAVDEHVGKHLIQNVLGPTGMLKKSARILATNNTRVLKSARSIYYLQEGRITESGTYDELMAKDGHVKSLVNSLAQQRHDSSGDETPLIVVDQTDGSSSATPSSSKASVEIDAGDTIQRAVELAAAAPGPPAGVPEPMEELDDDGITEITPLLLNGKSNGVKNPASDAEQGQGQMAKGKVEAMSGTGRVKWSIYTEYFRACGTWAILAWLLIMLSAQAFALGSGLWIKHWSDLNDEHHGNYQAGKYLGIYIAFGAASAVLAGIEGYMCMVVCGITAASKLHDRMAVAIFRAPMSFFETTPAGQILNRFSSDVQKIDSQLVRSFTGTLANLAYVVFTIGVVCWTTPLFLILIVPMAYVCGNMQQYYVRTTRELQRVESATKSPIFSHFQESLSGMASIRAYQKQVSFSQENEARIDANLRAFLCYIAANRWVLLRLEVLGSVVIGGAAGLAVAALAAGYRTSAGSVGLAMSFALQITTSLSWFVRMSVEIETNLVAVERVAEYSNITPEAPDEIEGLRPSSDWPTHGALTFKDYSVRYRPGLPLVLDNINLDIKAGERIGIVGRTGAGKSTLTLSLFRLIEPTTGHISIDSLNTSTIGLVDLRSHLAIIPQDSTILQGTIRQNLDPSSKNSDLDLWRALEHAQLKDHVAAMPDGLDAQLWEGGTNLSQGQRQLVSLARALLTSSRVVVLDEATSAVDHATDKLLQKTLRSEVFEGRTIVTIAHRIETVVDSDRIVVLERGRVVEFGAPGELVRRGGLFGDLVREAGLLGRFA